MSDEWDGVLMRAIIEGIRSKLAEGEPLTPTQQVMYNDYLKRKELKNGHTSYPG